MNNSQKESLEITKTFPEKNTNIHHHIDPYNIRDGEQIHGIITIDGKPIKIKIWSLSPIGAEIVWNEDPFKIGDCLDLTLFLGEQEIQFKAIKICDIRNIQNQHLIGIRWYSEAKEKPIEQDRSLRWAGSEFYAPTVTSINPLQFDDTLIFKVMNISSTGALLVTSLRNKFLVKGMTLEGIWSFPMTGALSCEYEIRWTKITSVSGSEKLSVGIQFKNKPQNLDQIAGEYILQFGDGPSLLQLRKSGLMVRNVKQSIVIHAAQTKEDYESVIELRRIAYAKYSSDEISEMTDVFDTRSRILVAKHNGKVVGTLRLTFHNPDDTSEIGKAMKLPTNYPQNHESIEISRYAVHPDYNRSTLFRDLLKQAYLILIQTKRRYLIGSAPDDLSSGYQSLGAFIYKDFFYSPKSCPDLKLYLFHFDLFDILTHPEKVSLKIWISTYDDLVDYLTMNKLFSLSPASQLRLKIYRFIRFFYKVFT